MKRSLFYLVFLVVLFACGKRTEETTPIRKDVTETVFASGVLEANNSYALTARADGYLADVKFNENDMVSEGQLLAIIDNKQNIVNSESSKELYEIAKQNASSSSPLLMQAQNAVRTTKNKMEHDSLQLQRYKKLLDARSIAAVDYENMALQYQTSRADYLNAIESYQQQKKQADQQLITSKTEKDINALASGFNQIRAVNAGKVYQKLKNKGDFVSRGEAIAIIGDADFIYAKVSIDENSIAQVKVGQEAVIQINTNKEKTYKGKVAEILPAFNEQTQSFLCNIHFVDSLDFRIINTQLQVNIITGSSQNALLIPRNYLQYGNLVNIKGEKEPAKIKTKYISSEWVQVLSGIDENTVIVTEKTK